MGFFGHTHACGEPAPQQQPSHSGDKAGSLTHYATREL